MKNKKIKLKSVVPLLLVITTILGAIGFFSKGNSHVSGQTVKVPSLTIGSDLSGENVYISFLGDSITTYEGWSNNGESNSTIANNGVYYDSLGFDY